MALNEQISKVVEAGSLKVAGEHSLTLGEIVVTVLALVVILWGAKIPVVGKFLGSDKSRALAGIALVFIAEWVW